jgi:alkylation response protein AidB-like acyl-CoA dehydrogenase
MDGDRPRLVAGVPQLIMAVVPVAEIEIVDTWFGLGMRGSDSNDVSLRDVFVPSRHTSPMVPGLEPNRYYRAPLYGLPVVAAVVLASISPIAVALARNAIEEVRALSSKRVPMASMVPLRDRGVAQARLGRAEAMLRSARGLMYDEMSNVWERTRAGGASTLQQRADVLLAAAHTAQVGAEVVDMMFTSGGSSAVLDGHPLQKLFRDAQVIRQHGFVCSARYETFCPGSCWVSSQIFRSCTFETSSLNFDRNHLAARAVAIGPDRGAPTVWARGRNPPSIEEDKENP